MESVRPSAKHREFRGFPQQDGIISLLLSFANQGPGHA